MHNKRALLAWPALILLLVGIIACGGKQVFEERGTKYGEYGNMHINGAVLAEGEFYERGVLRVAATPAGTSTPQVLIDDKGAGVPFEIRNSGATPEVSFTGAYELDMGANYITNIGSASTDFTSSGGLTLADDLNMSNQPIVNVGAAGTDFGTDGALTLAGALALTQVNAASGSANPFDYTGTLGIMNGSDTFEVIDINVTSANHTSTSNVVTGIDVGIAAADADAVETGILIGSGWDSGLTVASTSLFSDGISSVATNPTGSGDDMFDWTVTLTAMNGSDTVNGLDFQVTSANHTSTANYYNAINLGLANPDADATETAINIADADFDTGIKSIVNLENIGLPSVISVALTYESTGAQVTVGANEIWLVQAVFVEVTTNFDCTGDDCHLDVGDSNDVDGFLVLTDTELQAADTEGTGFSAGWQGMAAATIGAYLDGFNGFIYDGAETIDVDVHDNSAGEGSAGAATLWILYTRIL